MEKKAPFVEVEDVAVPMVSKHNISYSEIDSSQSCLCGFSAWDMNMQNYFMHTKTVGWAIQRKEVDYEKSLATLALPTLQHGLCNQNYARVQEFRNVIL